MSPLACYSRCIPQLKYLYRRGISQKVPPMAAERGDDIPPTSKSTKQESHRTLPEVRMRTLISLYHQADSWITPENLLQRIDDAFVPKTSANLSLPSLPAQEGIALQDLTSAANQVKVSPKMTQLEAEPSFRRLGEKGMWHTMSKREKMMFEALYGVNVNGKEVLPGLEVLKAMTGELKKNRDCDREDEEGMDISDLIRQ